jgi:hypothetical protein
MTPVCKSSLSPARKRLVSLLDFIHFGRLEELHVCRGEPSFDPAPRAIRTVKIAGTVQPPRRPSPDFILCREINDLLALLSTLRDGIIGRIEVAHGLPLFVEVSEPLPVE